MVSQQSSLLSALALLAIPFAAILVPAFASGAVSEARHKERPHHPWLTLLRQRAFVRVAAALVLGSHAMYDSFAVIRWSEAGISPATIGMLWSESVTGEVLVLPCTVTRPRPLAAQPLGTSGMRV